MQNQNAYASFVRKKLLIVPPVGITKDVPLIDGLFPHQDALVRWALRRGRSAIFADTGLGKTRMQIAWADVVHRETGGDILILAPLAVAQQTAEEAAQCGVNIKHVHEAADLQPGINITNYDRLHKFNTDRFVGIVLDESSIIKNHTGKTLQALIDAFKHTPYRLCATATPAPNDWTELGTHAEFLGIRSRAEMLAEFFVHDGGDTQTWRIKGHARQLFWKWVASWGVMLRSPADLGFDSSGYDLPPLEVHQHTVESEHDQQETGYLFAMEATDLMERRNARKASLDDRVKACADLVNSSSDTWVIWCDLNAEGDALRMAIPGAVEIRGTDSEEVKEQRLHNFAHGKTRVLITKASITGWGLNWQFCNHTAFVGVTDSWEAYYQAVRRFWRFGQKKSVNVHIFASEQEGSIVANLKRKEADAKAMGDALAIEVLESVKSELFGQTRESNPYQPRQAMKLPSFLKSQ